MKKQKGYVNIFIILLDPKLEIKKRKLNWSLKKTLQQYLL